MALITEYRTFIKNAMTGIAPINGLYILYTTAADTALPVSSGGVVSGGLPSIVSALGDTNTSVGLAKVPNIAGGITSSSIRFIGTTANGVDVAGIPLSNGGYVRAVMGAALSTAYSVTSNTSADNILDYNELETAVNFTVNGNVTVIDEVTL